MKPSVLVRPLRLGAAGAAACVFATAAFAHAYPVSSRPAPNASGAAPARIAIDFSEPLEPAFSRITLADAYGKPVATGASSASGKLMVLPLGELGAGRYTVHWSAVATDGHRTQGDYSFTVQ